MFCFFCTTCQVRVVRFYCLCLKQKEKNMCFFVWADGRRMTFSFLGILCLLVLIEKVVTILYT